jgi:hypothetical protein
MMMRATFHQPASVATEANWPAGYGSIRVFVAGAPLRPAQQLPLGRPRTDSTRERG